ncbi:hypothetical protein [Mannheimia indoligenes]|uniref:hypothetical protein n=1 Tax=Mannheimia indoligenes TaxID=3103145 RepID=UPI002FE562D7
MNLNPFYHLRRYREIKAKLVEAETFNESLLERNRDLGQDLAHARTELDKANRKIDYLTSEFEALQSEFVILVNAKKLTKKEAREWKNHKHYGRK